MTGKVVSVLFAFAVIAVMLAGCRVASTVQTPAAVADVQTVQDAGNFSRDQALHVVKQTINVDYTKYTVKLVNDRLRYNGQDYYQFIITDGKKEIGPAVIVSRENGALYCYNSDKTVSEVDSSRTFATKC